MEEAAIIRMTKTLPVHGELPWMVKWKTNGILCAKEYRDYAYLPVGKNNFKNFLQQGYVTNNNLSVGYKMGNASLRSSLNWIQNRGQYPNSTLNKYTYTIGGDINLKKFKLSSNFLMQKKHHRM